MFLEADRLLLLLHRQARGFHGAGRVSTETRGLLARWHVLMNAYMLRGRVLSFEEMRDLSIRPVVMSLETVGHKPKYADDDVEQYRKLRGIDPWYLNALDHRPRPAEAGGEGHSGGTNL